MQNNPELLNHMMADQALQKSKYQPGPYWSEYCSRATHAIRKKGLNHFRSSHDISKGFGDSVMLNPFELGSRRKWKSNILKKLTGIKFLNDKIFGRYDRLIQSQYEKMKFYRSLYYDTRFGEWFREISHSFALPDTLHGQCHETVRLNGQTISYRYLRQLMRIYNFAQHIDFSSIRSVFEIGGGFGINAHLLLHLYPNIRKYLYMDIPPCLYIGTQYLRHFYNSDVCDYLQLRDQNRITFNQDDSRQIIAIAPWQIEKGNFDIDLFWNSSSFQEMTLESVDHYLQHIQRFMRNGGHQLACLTAYKSKSDKSLQKRGNWFSLITEVFDTRRINPKIEEGDRNEYFLGKLISTHSSNHTRP